MDQSNNSAGFELPPAYEDELGPSSTQSEQQSNTSHIRLLPSVEEQDSRTYVYTYLEKPIYFGIYLTIKQFAFFI